MAQTSPTPITPGPATGPQRGNRSTFSTLMDAFVVWILNAVAQFNALASNVYSNAVDAYNNASAASGSAQAAAISADAAATSANAPIWVSGTSYTVGQCRFSPIDGRTYRRRIAGAGTTDPSVDLTNWTLLSGVTGFSNLVVLASTQSWVCPANVTKAEITVIDGGTGGSRSSGGSASDFLPGGKGGNTGVSILTLTPSATYTATVGAGGASSSGGDPGGSTSFSGAGITTITSANAALKIPGGRGDVGGLNVGPAGGGGTPFGPRGSTGYGVGGLGGSGSGGGGPGTSGVVIIRY